MGGKQAGCLNQGPGGLSPPKWTLGVAKKVCCAEPWGFRGISHWSKDSSTLIGRLPCDFWFVTQKEFKRDSFNSAGD
jgi:hypothetical protein